MKKILLLVILALTAQTIKAQTVVIGTQTWTTKNLDVATYSDGTVIPQVTDPTEWANLTTGAWCYYNNDSTNGATYGKLYNWYAVAGIYNEASKTDTSQRKQLAPKGYHIPSQSELVSTDLKDPNGFAGLPGGARYTSGTYYTSGTFVYIGYYGTWWSSSECYTVGAWSRVVSYNVGDPIRDNCDNKVFGFSVRCVKDNTLKPTSSAQTFCGSATVVSLVATGTNLKWYATETGGTALGSDVALASETYYVTQTIDEIESDRTAVLVTINPLTTIGSVATSICAGASYTWLANGVTYTTAQTGVAVVSECNTATLNLTITPIPNAGIISGVQTISSTGITTFASNGISGGAWSSSNTTIATINESTGVVTAVAGGNAIMTYTVIGSGGCTAKATRTVTVEDAFITTWVTTTGFETLTLSAQPDAPNYTINWGDGFTNTYTASQIPSHTYFNSGEHTVSFTGTFPHLNFTGQTKLKAVQQWGTQKWTSMANMFADCATFNSFPSQAPDLTLCTNMALMFQNATAFDQPIGTWNVSQVANMCGIFYGAKTFNQPIGSWDVSQVTDMSYMFYYANAFNQPIGAWNVSSVTNMSYMFYYTSAFNQSLGSWNVSKVTYMGGMFMDTKLSTANYDNLLIGWAIQGANGGLLQRNVSFSGGYSNYYNGLGARNYLINTYGWVISDGGASWNVLNNDITTQIGTQTWMTKNLDVLTYSDGTVIPQVTDPTEWKKLTTGAWCYINNEPGNGTTYGKLYNWYAVAGIHDNDPNTPNKNLAPIGWHVPTETEWTILTTFLGGEGVAGSKMKSTTPWAWANSPYFPPTNSSDFTGLPGGLRYSEGTFSNIGSNGLWWSLSESTSIWPTDPFALNIGYYYGSADRSYLPKEFGLSVRCVKNTVGSITTTVLTDTTTTTATSGGLITLDGGAKITARGVVWNTSSTPTIDLSTKTIDGSGIGTFNSVITGLNANTTYYVRAYAINEVGTVYGAEEIFTTPVMPTEVTIGNQTWTTKNLDVATYSDGTVIPQVTDHTEWANLTTGAWCYYDNDPANAAIYGKLYNWYAVAGIWNEASKTDASQRKQLVPIGYHVPSDSEWTTLTDYLGGAVVAGGKMKATGTTLWNSPNQDATNTSGFAGLPGGYRNYDGAFNVIGGHGYWGSSSENSTTNAWDRNLSYNNSGAYRNNNSKPYGFSVRCVSDEVLSNKTFEANSFKIYPNPASSVLNIKANDNLTNQPFIITDTLGKIVLKGKLNEGDTTINVEHLSKGVYCIKIANNKASKFIKE